MASLLGLKRKIHAELGGEVLEAHLRGRSLFDRIFFKLRYACGGWRNVDIEENLFSSSYYLNRNADVAAAGVNPLAHYLWTGWCEGRDPSGGFSSKWYLETNPDVRESAECPLEHYLRWGRFEGRSPHQGLSSRSTTVPSVAVVIEARNSPDRLRATLAFLAGAKGGASISVIVVENGESPSQSGSTRDVIDEFNAGVIDIELIELDEAVKIGAAYNAVVKAAERKGFTHFCFLEPGRLCVLSSIMSLVATSCPVVSPMSNGDDCEQRLWLDCPQVIGADAMAVIDEFGREFSRSAAKLVVESVFMDPGCVLIDSRVFESCGYFDDVFSSRSIMFKDFATRVSTAGIKIHTANHVYVHDQAWGLDNSGDREHPDHELIRDAERFREKWGAIPQDTPRKIYYGPRTASAHLSSDAAGEAYAALWSELTQVSCAGFHTYLASLQAMVSTVALAFERGPPVILFAFEDPVTGNEKDGYVQRVRAIDSVLATRDRIYVVVSECYKSGPVLSQLATGVWRIDIREGDPAGEALISALLSQGAPIYSHSIVGLGAQSVRQLIKRRSGPAVLDLHGVVPEEFAMHHDRARSQLFDLVERDLAGEVDQVIVVSEAMGRHFVGKHADLKGGVIVCPIFTSDCGDLRDKKYNIVPRAVYAGGAQIWQMIPDLADLIASSIDHCVFDILTPHVYKIGREVERHAGVLQHPNLSIRSVPHAEVLNVYDHSDFGIILRADSVVNSVSCPTKFIEYISYGLVPVLSSTEIGDFVAKGVRYVDWKDFQRNLLPNPRERAEMAVHNFDILQGIAQQSSDGRKAILSALGMAGNAPFPSVSSYPVIGRGEFQ
jgi:GT2 family glycosyltransferase